jgi:hypothetical protein
MERGRGTAAMDQPTAGYEEDVFAWSQHQAALLRALAGSGLGLPNELDLEHVAEEIEDVGNSELNSVLSHLEGMLIHLAKAASSPEANAARHWLNEVNEHQRQALRCFTPGMARRIDAEALWRSARRRAAASLALFEEKLADLPDGCPYGLADLLSDEPNATVLLARLRPSLDRAAAP